MEASAIQYSANLVRVIDVVAGHQLRDAGNSFLAAFGVDSIPAPHFGWKALEQTQVSLPVYAE